MSKVWTILNLDESINEQRGEWPSGLRRNQNWKVPESNPNRPSAGLRGPVSLRGFPVTLGLKM